MNEPIGGVTPEVMQALFAGVPHAPDALWQGEIYRLPDGRELIPFVFLGLWFLAIFSAPVLEAGGDEEFLAEQAQQWAAGFQPDKNSRIVKFCRAHMVDRETLFRPEGNPLAHPRQIFAFSELLADVMIQHASTDPPVLQYFYWPATDPLERLYQRTFRRVCRELPDAFEPILADIGDFRGYQSIQT